MIKRIYQHFSTPANLALLNGLLIATLTLFNIYFQAFCIPTTWTIILLGICFINTIFYPILLKTKIAALTTFINGITLFIFIYCIIFLEHINFLGLFMVIIGIGLVILIPPFFVIQLIYKNVINPIIPNARYYFLAATAVCIGAIMYIGQDYRKAIDSIEKFEESNYTVLDKNFMTEKILGMHFIYHTRFCEYDGWRPPKHEPILVIGMWLNNRIDPLNVDLETRLALYKKFFPNNKYKFDCSCGIMYSDTYHQDALWR
jgi:hypothetical protein